MADFRRWILALAMLVLVLGCVAPASAQVNGPQITCTASAAVTPTLRHEGMDELVGDILLTCTANSGVKPIGPGQPVPQADISVSIGGAALSTNSYYVPGPPAGWASDAVLVIDDPTPANQTLCANPINPTAACQVLGLPANSTQSFNAAGVYNVFQGVPGGPAGQANSITFLGVPIDPPVTSRTFRITNVRVNASGAGGISIQGGLTPVLAFVSSSSSTSVQINNPQNYVGFVANGLTTTVTTPTPVPNFLNCQTYTQTVTGSITFTEDFATSFKVQGLVEGLQNQPGTVYYTESGLQVTITGAKGTITSSTASTGTELMATISNIPSNATVSVDSWAQSTAAAHDSEGNLVQQSDATFVPANGVVVDPCPDVDADECDAKPVQLTVSSTGTAVAVWEITNTNSSAVDSLSFNIYVGLTSAPGTTPPTQPTTVQGSFAPISLTNIWANGDPIPEFNGSVNPQTGTSSTLFTISPCVTYLLFPYVTDYLGEFDTGIAISNTSTDAGVVGLGALPQTGGCQINFYGMDQTTGANTATTIGSSGVYSTTLAGTNSGATSGAGEVLPGQTWTFSISGIDSAFGTNTFVGYAIAKCDFQYAHGYTFVSDYGVREWAAASLALVIPDTGSRVAFPFLCGSVACNGLETGEQLVH